MQLGYLVPEFPGQTHAFFWREIVELERLGVDVDVVSTAAPRVALRSHAWTPAAMRRTTYLNRPGTGASARSALLLLRAAASGRLARTVRAARPLAVRTVGVAVVAGALLAERAQRKGWSHVHVHSAGTSALIAWAASSIDPKLSYSITLHGPLSDYGAGQALKWRHATFGLVITEKLRRELGSQLGDAAPTRLAIAPMGIDSDSMRRTSPYQPWTGGRVCLFSCGRLNPAKGHDTAIEALALLRNRGWEANLTIAGEDDQGGEGYRRELEHQIAQRGLADHVHLLGAVSEDEVRRRLEASHVFVLASRGEPLGVAIMEAMAMGTPIVVGDGGGVRELLGEEPVGTLVPPGRMDELAGAIEAILNDPSTALGMSARAEAHVRAHFTSRSSAGKMLDMADSTARVDRRIR